MDTPTTEPILKRAYEIWEKNSKPRGGMQSSIIKLNRSCITRTDLRRCAHRITFN
jgi:hypothetical protein